MAAHRRGMEPPAAVTIEHWWGCGYPDAAARLASEIEGALGLSVRTVQVDEERAFTLRVGGGVVLTRAARGRLPTPDEALDAVAAAARR